MHFRDFHVSLMRLSAFFCVFLLSGFLFSVKSQNFQSELLIGVNASQIDGDALWGYNKPGLLAGAMITYPFSEKFAAQTGFLYSAKGSKHGKDDPQFFIWRLNYLEMPWTARVLAFEKIYFSGGITANYLISSKVDAGYGFVSSRRGFKAFDFCYLVGVAYKPLDNAAFQVRLVNGWASANRLEFFRNRSLSFAAIFYLGKSR